MGDEQIGDAEAGLQVDEQLEDLCLLWGTESFAIGLQLGLRLMAGQRADGLLIS